MVEKDELYSIDDKTLAGIIVNKGFMEDMLGRLLTPFSTAVLEAPSPETTILHKNRYDAAVAFGNMILTQLNEIAEMTPPPAENVQFDS